jgi:hypothetical protein
MSRMASWLVPTFSLLSNAADGPPRPATRATPSFGIPPVTQPATSAVRSTVTNSFPEPARRATVPSTWPSGGAVAKVTVVSLHDPVTLRTSIVPGLVVLLTQSRSVAFERLAIIDVGREERSNLRRAVEAGVGETRSDGLAPSRAAGVAEETCASSVSVATAADDGGAMRPLTATRKIPAVKRRAVDRWFVRLPPVPVCPRVLGLPADPRIDRDGSMESGLARDSGAKYCVPFRRAPQVECRQSLKA